MPLPFVLVFIAALWLCGPASAENGRDSPPLVFGVVPQQTASDLARGWTPVLDYLRVKTGLNLRFATAKDIPTYEKRLADGEYDFAYMNPYHYTVFHRQPGYRPLAREGDRPLKGIVVVRQDSPLRDFAELKGQTVAFPGPAAFAATLLPRARLEQLGVPIVAKYVSSHDSVYLAVARGLYAAGGGIPRTFDNMPAETRAQLRILWTTPAYTPHAIAAHPRVPAATAERVKAALLGMAHEVPGAALLKAIGFNPLVAAGDADYDDVRRLDIRLPELAAPR